MVATTTMDAVITSWANSMGGVEIIFELWALTFVFTIMFMFYKITT